MTSLYAGFFGSWEEKVLYQTLKFHILGALTLKYLSTLELLWIPLRLCLRTSEHLFQVKRKPKELNSPNQIKDALCYVFICQNWTHGPLQRDPHHQSGGSVTATCLPFEYLPRENNILLMQISHSVQDFIPDRAHLMAMLAPILCHGGDWDFFPKSCCWGLISDLQEKAP